MDCTITVTYGATVKKLTCEYNSSLYGALFSNGLISGHVETQCGGRGLCGKCTVQAGGRLNAPTTEERFLLGERLNKGERLACCCLVRGDVFVTLPAPPAKEPEPESKRAPADARCGFAVDLGTTTICVTLFDLTHQQVLCKQSELNPQRRYGADVISRVHYASQPGGLRTLHDCAASCINGIMLRMLSAAGVTPQQIDRVSLVGNTCMQNIISLVDVTPLGSAPYTPLTRDSLILTPNELAFSATPHAEITVCGAVSGFIGGDAICAALVSGAYKSHGPVLIVDFGTNAEIALCNKDALLFTSAAAGPAFEGAGLSCGSTAVPGAIWRVRRNRYTVECDTVAGMPPRSVCGTGAVDAVAVMLSLGLIDSGGRILIADELPAAKRHLTGIENGERVFYLGKSRGLYITQSDVRAIQLAKAAVAAGIKKLLDCFDITGKPDEFAAVYFTGSFGELLNNKNAAAIGMIPESLLPACGHLYNTALEGATLLLSSSRARAAAEHIRTCARAVELEAQPDFNDLFISCMGFKSPRKRAEAGK